MNRYELTVDFNGLILFDPSLLAEFMGGVEHGQNLWKVFSETTLGDEVVKAGVLVPLLGINDSFYRVDVRMQDEPSAWAIDPFKTNSLYALRVSESLVLADVAVLLDWEEGLGWHDVPIKPGNYAVEINGFRLIEAGQVVDFGFEFVLRDVDEIPEMSASMDKNMQVLTLED